jgi:hypothetical protein
MAANENHDTLIPNAEKSARPGRQRLRKALPTDRVTFAKQLDILRAVAASSGIERKPVSNEEIAKVVNIHFGSISNCNPFFLESGLLTRHKHQNIPCKEVFDYAERYEWEPEKAAQKLAPVIRNTWFCSTLIPKLTFRPLSIDDAVSYLAEEAGASKDYRGQLSILIEYLRVAGIVSVEGNTVSLIKIKSTPDEKSTTDALPIKSVDSTSREIKAEDSHDDLNPFISGLLKTLPKPGTDWPMSGRIKWLQTASHIFGLIYTDPNGNELEYIEITKKQL